MAGVEVGRVDHHTEVVHRAVHRMVPDKLVVVVEDSNHLGPGEVLQHHLLLRR